jgi:hypothetical protein
VWAVAGVLAACGGSDGETCGDFTPCGGDLVGDWSVQAACGTAKLSSPVCSGLTLDFDHLMVSGTQTFTAAGAYSTDLSVAGSFTMHWPSGCLKLGAVTVTCDQLNAGLMTAMGMDVDTIQSVACSKEPQGCACVATYKPMQAAGSGTYTVDGKAVKLTDAAGQSGSNEFCVSGSTLRWRPAAAAAMMTPGFDFRLNEVFSRK